MYANELQTLVAMVPIIVVGVLLVFAFYPLQKLRIPQNLLAKYDIDKQQER